MEHERTRHPYKTYCQKAQKTHPAQKGSKYQDSFFCSFYHPFSLVSSFWKQSRSQKFTNTINSSTEEPRSLGRNHALLQVDFAFIPVAWEPTPQATGQALLPSSLQKKDAPWYTTGDALPCSTRVQAFKWTLSQCAASLALLSDGAVSLPQGLLTSGTTESLLLWGEKWCIGCQEMECKM